MNIALWISVFIVACLVNATLVGRVLRRRNAELSPLAPGTYRCKLTCLEVVEDGNMLATLEILESKPRHTGYVFPLPESLRN